MTAMLQPAEPEELLTYDEVRDRLGAVHDRTIARWAQHGQLTRVRIGRAVYITRESVDRFISRRVHDAEQQAVRAARAARLRK